MIAACLLVLSGLAFFERPEKEIVSINLRFNTNYKGDTITRQKTGLAWALSYLGAALEKGSLERSLIPLRPGIYELRLDKLGFNKAAIQALAALVQDIRSTEEYSVKGGIDLGEFVVFTIGSSWHYYEITGAARKLDLYKARYSNAYELVFPVTNSSVAKHHRLLRMVKTDDVSKMSFIAEEGTGDVRFGSFKAKAYEVFDIMENGQLRFAIYDEQGNLSAASEKKFGIAGKPSKCLWCHEIYIEPLFEKNDSVKGYMTPSQFKAINAEQMKALNLYRENLSSDVDFSKKQDHALMELLYISYMEPSVFKLSGEWDQDELKLAEKLKLMEKHNHREYSFLNNLFRRAEVKRFSPYASVQLPDSIWEENDNEPNIFRKK